LQQYRALTVDEPTAVKIKNGLRLSCEQLKLFDAPLGEVYRIYEKEELIALLKVIESAEGKVLAIDKTFF